MLKIRGARKKKKHVIKMEIFDFEQFSYIRNCGFEQAPVVCSGGTQPQILFYLLFESFSYESESAQNLPSFNDYVFMIKFRV
jgi:hypothetical protein